MKICNNAVHAGELRSCNPRPILCAVAAARRIAQCDRAIDFGAARVGEVESGATPGGSNESRDMRKLTKQVDKMASSLRKKNGEIDQLTDDLEQLTRRLAKLELQARAPKGGCCVVM